MGYAHSFTLGSLKCHALETGGIKLDGGAMFGVVPKPLWSKRIPADERNRIQLGMRCLLIEHPDGLTLIDTGLGNKQDDRFLDLYGVENQGPHGRTRLEAALAETGHGAADVKWVINTHLHFDHAGGNTWVERDETGVAIGGERLTFPNATYVAQWGELEFARNTNERTRASYLGENFEPISEAGKWKLLRGDVEILPGISARVTPGHVPHHQSIEVKSGGDTLLFLADVMPTSHHLSLPWIMGYDLEPMRTLESKRKSLRIAEDEGWWFFFEHDADVIMGRIGEGSKGHALGDVVRVGAGGVTGPVPESLSAALADRYRIERAIGQGGMATVYQATDLKHGRRVAVKVLRSDLAASVGSERFLREITIAAQLQHPHILLLIDSGEAGGHLYYVMPLVEGGSLRTRLDTGEAISVDEVTRLARQVSDALDYAHRRGLVHRDIKPENILLNDGLAVVADFGIAKALTEASDRSLTRTGFPLGTVGYMSPEQAAGFTALDARSDVFSLACVIYELLVGRIPGMWPSDESLRVQRFLEAPPEHRRQLDLLPAAAEQVLVRGLALRPDSRYPGPKAMVDDLLQAFRERPRFDEGQVRNIVARASELEATALTADGSLTLGGIQRLAAEVGIPPQHVDRAARELRPEMSSAELARSRQAWTSQPRIVVERWIEGDIPDDEYATIVDEVRMTVGNVGQSSTLGRSLAWRTVVPSGQLGRNVSLLVTPSQGRTRLRIEETVSNLMGGYFGAIVGGGSGAIVPGSIGLAIGAMSMPLMIPVFLLVGYGAAIGTARHLYLKAYNRRARELSELAERLVAHLVESRDRQAGRRLRPLTRLDAGEVFVSIPLAKPKSAPGLASFAGGSSAHWSPDP